MPSTIARRLFEQRTLAKVFVPRWVFLLSCLYCAWPLVPRTLAGETAPLHERIDQAIEQAQLGPLAAVTDDATFARRLYLDLVGRVPTTAELEQFLSTPTDQRRAQLIDQLLSSAACNKHLAVVLDVMLMERRPDKYVKTDEWRQFLETSLAQNKPFHQLVAEIILATGEDSATRGAAKFLLDREVETHAVTRDFSRMFLGRDVQCAQCHDHPLIADYSQEEYYGLLSFLNRSFLFEKTVDKDQKVSLVGERADGDVTFASVFEPDAEKSSTLPTLPNGLAFDQEPITGADDAYRVAPADNVLPVPRISRRAQLAQLTAAGRSDLFRRNAANRLWRILMKRGLVEPPDFIHSDNPATYPLLLNELADALSEMNFDVKAFLRQVALSQAYQRDVALPEKLLDEAQQTATRLDAWRQQLTFQAQVAERAEQQWDDAFRQLRDARKALLLTRQEQASTQKQHDEAVAKQGETQKKRDELQQQRDTQQQQVQLLEGALENVQAVAQQRKDDKELASTVERLTDQTEQARQRLAQLDQEIAAQDESIKQLAATRDETAAKLGELRETHDLQAARAKEEGGAYRATKQLYEFERARQVSLNHQIQLAEQTLALRDARAKLEEIVQRRQSLNTQQATLQTQREAVQTAHQEQSSQLATLQGKLEQTQQQLQDAARHLTDHRQLVQSLREATAQVAAARDQLQGDAELAAAHERLAARIEQLQQQSATLEQSEQTAQAAVEEASQACMAATARLTSVGEELVRVDQQLAQLKEQLASVRHEQEEAQMQVDLATGRVRDRLIERFVVASPQALSPEQMAASVICALNLEPTLRAQAEKEWQDKYKKQSEDKPAEPIDDAQRAEQIEALYQQRHSKVESTFVSLFAATPGSPQDTFFATVDQALFLANNGQMQSWLRPQHGNLTDRLLKHSSTDELTREMYLSILSRMPDDAERQAVADYLNADAEQRDTAVQDMIWSMLTSVEFRFNH